MRSYDPYPVHSFKRTDLFRYRRGNVGGKYAGRLNKRVCVIALGFVREVLDIDPVAGQHARDICDDRGNIGVQRADACSITHGNFHRRIIDRVADIARAEVSVKLTRRHYRAVILGFLGRRAKVRDVDYPLYADSLRRGEIGDIACHLTGGERFLYVGGDRKIGTREVDDAHAVLHFCFHGLSCRGSRRQPEHAA